MTPQNWFRFLLLCAIWGSSFVFIRMCAPVLGPPLTAAGRLGLAGLALAAFLRATGRERDWRRHAGDYFRVGLLASGVPFLCFAIGALHLPASLLAIINACTPLFGAVFAARWLSEPFGWQRAVGVVLGLTGVTVANGLSPVAFSPITLGALLVALLAPLCYALAGIYIKLRASHLSPAGNAAYSQLLVAPVLFLMVPMAPPTGVPSGAVVGALLTLALLCSAVAYTLFYRLMAEIGPTRVTTITFVIPVFGMLWGALFLGETITAGMIFGCAIMLVGTGLVVARPVAPRPGGS